MCTVELQGAMGHLKAAAAAIQSTCSSGTGSSDARPGDWACAQCSNTNFARRTECNKCGSAKPQQAVAMLGSGSAAAAGGSSAAAAGGGVDEAVLERANREDVEMQEVMEAAAGGGAGAAGPQPRWHDRHSGSDGGQGLARELLAAAGFLFCTLGSVGSAAMRAAPAVHTLLVDEAAQAVEAEALSPLLCRPRRCLLVGDPMQLSAVVQSPAAQRAGYGRSMMGRLMGLQPVELPLGGDDGGGAVRTGCNADAGRMLDTQYRMHPDISRFPSARFYGGRLRDGGNVLATALSRDELLQEERGPAGGAQSAVRPPFSPPFSPRLLRALRPALALRAAPLAMQPYSFVDVEEGREEQRGGGAGGSYFNQAEADVVAELLMWLRGALNGASAGGSGGKTASSAGGGGVGADVSSGAAACDWHSELAVLTFYAAQAQALRDTIRRAFTAATAAADAAGAASPRWRVGAGAGAAKARARARGAELQSLLSRVFTVDSFQGSEAGLVLVSFVRANAGESEAPPPAMEGQAQAQGQVQAQARGRERGARARVGFLAEFRRLNVAITRAQHCLVCVGHARTLRLAGGGAGAGGGGSGGAGAGAGDGDGGPERQGFDLAELVKDAAARGLLRSGRELRRQLLALAQ